MKNCQCEHISHLDKNEKTPNGNPGHKYGAKFYDLRSVKTPYGIFHVCADCENDCAVAAAKYDKNPAAKPERGTFIEIRGTKTGKLYLILNASIGTMRELRMTAQRVADKYKEQVSVKRVTRVKKNPTRKKRKIISSFGKEKRKSIFQAKIRAKKNPAAPQAEIREAAQRFEAFTGHRADKAREVKTPAAKVALAIGPLLGVAYETTRDGKHEKYYHEFRSHARPLLAASSDGHSLFMLGGAYRFTERGIVDSPKKRAR